MSAPPGAINSPTAPYECGCDELKRNNFNYANGNTVTRDLQAGGDLCLD